jgi:transcriptional regulator GlxA family with amidase domain
MRRLHGWECQHLASSATPDQRVPTDRVQLTPTPLHCSGTVPTAAVRAAIQLNVRERSAAEAILNCTNIAHATVLAPPVRAGRAGRESIVSRLLNFSRTMREVLDQEVLDAGSWQLERVEQYIAVHLDVPFQIERIAEVTGFNDVGRFSKRFSKAFGKAPSAVPGKRPR